MSPRWSCRTMSSAARWPPICATTPAMPRSSRARGARNSCAARRVQRQAGGSSERFKRILLLDEPPSLDSGELTDKGSINQRAVLALRIAEVEELYAPSRPQSDFLRRAHLQAVSPVGGEAMNVNDLIAIDTHTHAEVSCRQPRCVLGRSNRPRPNISNPAPSHHRRDDRLLSRAQDRLVMFTVDSEFEVATAHLQRRGRRAAPPTATSWSRSRRSIRTRASWACARRRPHQERVIKGFKFHPTLQGSSPTTGWLQAL